jgi:hypothetical protein
MSCHLNERAVGTRVFISIIIIIFFFIVSAAILGMVTGLRLAVTL